MWFDSSIYIDAKNLTVKKLAKYKNNIAFQMKFMEFVGDALNRYKITGLPDTCNERVVKESLLWYGDVFFFEKFGNLVALPGLPDGSSINTYGDYAGAYVFAPNGVNERIKLILPNVGNNKFLERTIQGQEHSDGEGVLVRENAMIYPFMKTVVFYADAIADTMRTLDVCRENIKRPFIVTAEESVVPSVRQYFKNVANNESYVISSGVFPADKVSVIPFDNNPQYCDTASSLIDWYEQKFREQCGFQNMGGQIDKKGENLISEEVTQNDQYTDNKITQALYWLNAGFDLVNSNFGTNIRAERNDDIPGTDRSEQGDMAFGSRSDTAESDN